MTIIYKEKREIKLFSSQLIHSIGCSEKKETNRKIYSSIIEWDIQTSNANTYLLCAALLASE